jgi:hypothetical protein
MRNTNKKFRSFGQIRLSITLVAGSLLLLSSMSLAQQSNQEVFPLPEKATQALFEAVESNNEQSILKVLGGEKDLLFSGDALEEQRDRQLFLEKYRQMHRLVEEADGTHVLYIGAENWPFPIPLVSKNGGWYFDVDAGIEEIRFRRVGRNEANAVQYARDLLNGDAAGSRSVAASGQQSSAPLYGYYFRQVEERKAGSPATLAFPAEYRSTGVMTFVVAPNGVVYEKDLGPQTAILVNAMTTWKPDRSWHMVQDRKR